MAALLTFRGRRWAGPTTSAWAAPEADIPSPLPHHRSLAVQWSPAAPTRGYSHDRAEPQPPAEWPDRSGAPGHVLERARTQSRARAKCDALMSEVKDVIRGIRMGEKMNTSKTNSMM